MGVSFCAAVSTEFDGKPGWTWAWPSDLSAQYLDIDSEDLQENPKYRKELDVELSNANARVLCEAIEINFASNVTDTVEINHFIKLCENYLNDPRSQFDNDWFYLKDRVTKLINMARIGRDEFGATHIYGA